MAESVFIAGLFVHAAPRLACHRRPARTRRRGRRGYLRRSRKDGPRRCSEHGWDGEWFLRAYDDFGSKVGRRSATKARSSSSRKGFCVLAGIGLKTASRRRRCDAVASTWPPNMASCCNSRPTHATTRTSAKSPPTRRLQGERRHLLPRQSLGDDRRDHAWATAIAAHDYYTRINPSAREEISELHRCEPYVYAQMIAGKDAPTPRRSQELLAHRHRRVELRRRLPVPPRRAPRLRGAARGPGHR